MSVPPTIERIIAVSGLAIGAGLAIQKIWQAYDFYRDKYKTIGVGKRVALHYWFKASPFKAMIYVMVICGVIGALIGGAVFWQWVKNPPPAVVDDTAIFVESQNEVLPLTIPPKSSINIINLHSNEMKRVNYGFSQIGNGNDESMNWPQAAVIARKERRPYLANAFRCEVSNHGSVGFLSVDVPIVFTFGNKESIIYHAIIAPLDAGKAFSFYITNPTADVLIGVWQGTGTAHVIGEKESKSVTLRSKLKGPADQVFSVFPENLAKK